MPTPYRRTDPSARSLSAAAEAASADAREHVVAELAEHFAQDRLSLEEFERRTTDAYSAATAEDLARIVEDLPRCVDGRRVAPLPARLDAVLANLARGGPLAVPDHLHVRATAGNVELDLRQGEFRPGVTEIEVHALLGNVEIQLPGHVHVESHMSGMLSSFIFHEAGRGASTTSADGHVRVVRFTGRAVLSNVTAAKR